MEKKRISSRYRKDKVAAIDFDGIVSVAQQHFKAECDVNNIIDKYKRTGVLVDPMAQGSRTPKFGDFVGMDYQQHANRVALFNRSFALLPATVRAKFDNKPELLVDFLADPKNEAACIELGLLEKPVVVSKVDVVEPVEAGPVKVEIKPPGV